MRDHRAGQPFEVFLANRHSDLRRIASRTRGELSSDDLAAEAWLLAIEIGQKREWPFNFLDEDDQNTLLAWLHNRFVRYAEKAVRYAVRLDRDWDSEDSEQTGSALARLLTAPLDTDPQIRQQAIDEQEDLVDAVMRSYSEAAAYVLLLVRVDWHLEDLAVLLLIGCGTLKLPLRAFGLLARIKPSLFDRLARIDRAFDLRRNVALYSVASAGSRRPSGALCRRVLRKTVWRAE